MLPTIAAIIFIYHFTTFTTNTTFILSLLFTYLVCTYFTSIYFIYFDSNPVLLFHLCIVTVAQ
jgi:hypothetical protein